MNKKDNKLLLGISLFFVFIIGFLLIKLYSLSNPTGDISLDSSNIKLLPIFLTGLITGGLTCLAVQGGLLASTIAIQEEEKLKDDTKKNMNVLPIASFLVAKLIAYTFLGVLLGWFGSLFQLSVSAQIIMQLFVVIFMFGTAFNILNVHPIFRYFAIQPPKFLTRRIRSQAKSKSIFTPLILGAFTVFIPCGTTQAMMALAIGSGSPILGALIMFAFILGTTPLFFILGFFATKLGDIYQKRFMKIAAIALIVLALFNLRNVLSLANINLSFGKSVEITNDEISDNPTIEFLQTSYSPTTINVKAGSEVKLTLKNISGSGCIQSFVIPKLNLQKIVRVGTSETLTFKAPSEKGQIAFMCSMGMYRGIINVI